MARFTVRVELHGATWDDYAALYEQLAAYGITDVIASNEGIAYRMPPAEYNYEGLATRDQVLDAAKACAASVVRSYAVLVTEATARLWHGLERV